MGDNITLREKDLDNHIESERKPDADSAGPQESEQSLNNEQGMQRDYQLLRALDLLKGWELLKGLKKVRCLITLPHSRKGGDGSSP